MSETAKDDTYSGYDALAWFYDRYWGREFHQRALVALDNIVLRGLPPHARVLDLCCGTGHLTEILAGRGFSVVGVDGSTGMLRFARERAPQASFIAADARTFELGEEKFDLVLSTFDSMNHITDPRALAQTFRRVHGTLAEGGSFVFDVNTEEAYLSEWGKSSAIVEADNACIVRGSYDAHERIGRTEITLFRLLGDRWRRTDVSISQRCYDAGEIVSLLEAAGFGKVDAIRAADAGMVGDLGVGRCFFRAFRS